MRIKETKCTYNCLFPIRFVIINDNQSSRRKGLSMGELDLNNFDSVFKQLLLKSKNIRMKNWLTQLKLRTNGINLLLFNESWRVWYWKGKNTKQQPRRLKNLRKSDFSFISEIAIVVLMNDSNTREKIISAIKGDQNLMANKTMISFSNLSGVRSSKKCRLSHS